MIMYICLYRYGENKMLSTIVEISTVVTNIFLSVGTVIAVFQLIQMKKSNVLQSKSLMADHERRKKQSTLEFYSDIYPYLSEFRIKITDVFGNGYVTPDDIRYKQNTDIQKMIYEYLVIIERFAVGINSGIYDINVFAKTSGKIVSDMYKKLSPIIENMRIIQNYPEMFNDFEKMSKDIVEVREKMYPKLSGEDLVSIKNITF